MKVFVCQLVLLGGCNKFLIAHQGTADKTFKTYDVHQKYTGDEEKEP